MHLLSTSTSAISRTRTSMLTESRLMAVTCWSMWSVEGRYPTGYQEDSAVARVLGEYPLARGKRNGRQLRWIGEDLLAATLMPSEQGLRLDIPMVDIQETVEETIETIAEGHLIIGRLRKIG